MMPYKERLRTLVSWIGFVVMGVVLAQVLNYNVWLGISIIVLLFVGLVVYLAWGILRSAGNVDWAERQPKPKTQTEIKQT